VGKIVNAILLAIDGSPMSRLASDTALDLAQAVGATLTVVTVVPDTPPSFQGQQQHPSSEAMGQIDAVLEAASTRGLTAEYQVLVGNTADEITRFARDRSVDLIVLGSRGLGGVRSALLGSVSHAVLNQSQHSVLVVKNARARV
jgi:nucleotide-binding universal stress UspA family protein